MLGWFASLIIGCSLEIRKIYESVSISLDFSNWLLKPALAGLASGLTMKYAGGKWLIPMFGMRIGLVLSVGAILSIYFILVIAMGVISISDLDRFRRKPAAKPASV
jgi:stage V sporulation protein B